MSSRRFTLISLVVLASLVAPAFAKEEKKPVADEFTGVFISMNTPGAMGDPVQIWINSYTADDAAKNLALTLDQKGQPGLLDAILNLEVGRLRIGTSMGYPISVARQRVNADGSRTVFLVSNRPFVGFQPQGGTRIEDYPFGVVELKLDAQGKGEGQIIGSAQLSFDETKKNLNIASYAVQPGRISDVKTKAKKQ
jgi:hypothetical protein